MLHSGLVLIGNDNSCLFCGFQVGQDLGEDPRLKVLKKEWFEGKDCLDVGCNNGLITIHIGKKALLPCFIWYYCEDKIRKDVRLHFI